jgi:hypothetical protein
VGRAGCSSDLTRTGSSTCLPAIFVMRMTFSTPLEIDATHFDAAFGAMSGSTASNLTASTRSVPLRLKHCTEFDDAGRHRHIEPEGACVQQTDRVTVSGRRAARLPRGVLENPGCLADCLQRGRSSLSGGNRGDHRPGHGVSTDCQLPLTGPEPSPPPVPPATPGVPIRTQTVPACVLQPRLRTAYRRR